MKTHFLPLLLATFSSSLCLNAEALLFDFGKTATNEPTLSPGHANETMGNTWNSIGKNDIATGLFTDSGAVATGIGINLGTSIGDSFNVDFADNPDADYLTGTSLSTGVYINNAPGKDGIFENSDFETIGIQITGLAAGEYKIYLTGRNSNKSNDSSAFYVDQGASATSFDFGSPSLITMANTADTRNSWVNGDNYGVATITLTGSNALFIGLDGTGGSDDRAFLNTIEIVAIPEPSSFILLSLGGLLAGLTLMRKK
ncbi:PEP-CTERM sorting domain-containing protein [Kiritimatiellota bacterium B12222]|nr:PEP-CTERM sorting domain-containing protein [Kiritimatiellota bacterium B12222]